MELPIEVIQDLLIAGMDVVIGISKDLLESIILK